MTKPHYVDTSHKCSVQLEVSQLLELTQKPCVLEDSGFTQHVMCVCLPQSAECTQIFGQNQLLLALMRLVLGQHYCRICKSHFCVLLLSRCHYPTSIWPNTAANAINTCSVWLLVLPHFSICMCLQFCAVVGVWCGCHALRSGRRSKPNWRTRRRRCRRLAKNLDRHRQVTRRP